MRLNYLRTFVLGLGFFSISLSWSIYNSYVPIFLSDLLKDVAYRTTLVGIIMTFDNIAAITLQPYFGALSDRTWTRVGRRMPFLLAGVPVAAVFFALIPLTRFALTAMIPVIIVMNVAMTAFRAPTVALMPDITPSPLRSKANGIINFMGGLGALLAFFVFSQLFKVDPSLPFVVTSALMVVVLLVLLRTIREPRHADSSGNAGGGKEGSVGIIQAMGEVLADRDKSALCLLLAIFFWFVGWSGVEALFTLYGVEVWGMTPAAASFVLGFFSLSFLVFAIPSGFIATAIGRRRTILAGIVGLSLMLLAMRFARPGTTLTALLLVGGAAWALININSYPMVVDMTTAARIGAYTGLYYFFSALAAIVAPPVFGWFMDVLGKQVLFMCAFVSFAVAFALMLGVRRGEAVGTAPAAQEAGTAVGAEL
ncbi:MAG: MFS transporter [Firmicutes bacterium]|nr:MFS transporter [Bacillota bacterium]